MRQDRSDLIRHLKPLTLPAAATVQEACRRMHARKLGAALVSNAAGALVGIFTGRDAVRALARGRDPTTTALREVMTRRPVTISPGYLAIEALRLMRDGRFRHLPVVENGVILGIVERADDADTALSGRGGEAALGTPPPHVPQSQPQRGRQRRGDGKI